MKTLKTRIYSILQPAIILLLTILGMVILAVSFIISLFIVWLVPERYLITHIAGMCVAFVSLMVIPEEDW